MNVQRIDSQIKKKKKKRRKMASKAVFVAAVLIALVASASAGKLAHGRHLGWINGMKGDRLLACSHQLPLLIVVPFIGEQEGSRSVIDGEEGKFVAPVPWFKRPPLPPNSALMKSLGC